MSTYIRRRGCPLDDKTDPITLDEIQDSDEVFLERRGRSQQCWNARNLCKWKQISNTNPITKQPFPDNLDCVFRSVLTTIMNDDNPDPDVILKLLDEGEVDPTYGLKTVLSFIQCDPIETSMKPIIQKLLEMGADTDEGFLLAISLNCDVTIFKLIFEFAWNRNYIFKISSAPHFALGFAFTCGATLEVLKLIIDKLESSIFDLHLEEYFAHAIQYAERKGTITHIKWMIDNGMDSDRAVKSLMQFKSQSDDPRIRFEILDTLVNSESEAMVALGEALLHKNYVFVKHLDMYWDLDKEKLLKWYFVVLGDDDEEELPFPYNYLQHIRDALVDIEDENPYPNDDVALEIVISHGKGKNRIKYTKFLLDNKLVENPNKGLQIALDLKGDEDLLNLLRERIEMALMHVAEMESNAAAIEDWINEGLIPRPDIPIDNDDSDSDDSDDVEELPRRVRRRIG